MHGPHKIALALPHSRQVKVDIRIPILAPCGSATEMAAPQMYKDDVLFGAVRCSIQMYSVPGNIFLGILEDSKRMHAFRFRWILNVQL